MATRVSIKYGGTGANTVEGIRQALNVLSTTGGTFTGNLNVNSVIMANSRGVFGNSFQDHANTVGIDTSTVIVGAFANNDGPAEVMVVNKSNGSVAYSEFIALNDTANQEQGWISVGVNSSDYNDPEFTLTGPDDGYLLFEAPQGTAANGDLIIGTGSYGDENRIVLAAGGFEPTDAQLIIAPANLKSASIVQSSLNANIAVLTTSTTHNFIANDVVIISSVGAPYDGTRTILGVTSNTFNVSITSANVALANVSPAGEAEEFLPFNKGTVELTAQLFVGEDSRSTIEAADITLIQGHAIPLGIVVNNDGPGQTVMFNKSNGALSYSEFIAHNDAGNVEHGWISVGINSSGYDDPEFPITKADDGYLLFEAPEGTTGDGDLIIGTGAFGDKNRIIFAAEGFDEANAQMIITPNESIRISINTDASSSNTGALQVVGGVGVQGSMYVQGNQTIQGDLIVNGSQIIQSIENLAAAGPISLVSDGNVANTWDQGIVGTYAVTTSSVARDVEFKEIANNTGIISTSNNHPFIVEDIVTLAGVDATFNGTHRITAVTANTLSFYLLAGNVSKTSGSGTATVDKSTKYTGLVKKASDGTWRLFSNLGSRPAFNTDLSAANLAYDGIIAGSADFRGTLKLGSPNTATISYTDNNARALTIPALSGDRTFAFIDQAQTFTAAQGFNSTVTATKFIPTAGDATGNGLYLPSANRVSISADGVERVAISASETVINDGSADYDFRVESDGVAHMLFVDGGTNTVGIGTNAPAANLHVVGSGYFSGNVGIGRPTAAAKLDVASASGVGNEIYFRGGNYSDIDYSTGIRFLQPAGTTNANRQFRFTSGASTLSIQGIVSSDGTDTADTQLILQPAGGNVGIGTTNPGYLLQVTNSANTAKVYVSGPTVTTAGIPGASIFIRDTTAASGVVGRAGIHFSSSPGTDYTIGKYWDGTNSWFTVIDNSANQLLTISSGGSVGIGTTNPISALHVITSAGTTSTSAMRIRSTNSTDRITRLQFEDYNATIADGLVDFYIPTAGSSTGARLSLGVNSTFMHLINGGTVGIGTTDPSSLASTVQIHGRLNVVLNNSYGFAHYSSSSVNNQYLISQHISSANGFLLTTGRNGAPAVPYLAFGTADTERLRIANNNIYTAAGSAISYGSGETYQIWNDEDEVGIVSSDANWKNMKTFVCSKSGNLKFKFSAYISSGTYYFGWRILQNGSTVLAVNSFAGGLDAGESQSVHGYTRFVVSIGPIAAGDTLVLQMASTGGDAVPVTGNGQTLYAKEFRAYSTVPNVEHGGSTNIWGGRVGIGTTSPQAKLDVALSSTMGAYGPDAFNLKLTNTNTSETNSGSITFVGYSGNGVSPYPWGSISAEKQTSAGDTNYGGKLHLWTTSGGANGEANSGQYRRLTIDSSGNVGIGTTSPATLLDVRSVNTSGATGATIRVGSQNHGGDGNEFGNLEFYWGDPDSAEVKAKIFAKNVGNVGPGGGGAADLLFATRHSASGQALSERMRITTGGAIGVNFTNPAGYGQLTVGFSATNSANNNGVGLAIRTEAETSDAYFALFFNSTGSGIGSIRRVGTTNAVAFNTTSDRRLKENIVAANTASNLIDSIQVVQYDWKDGPHINFGVIAQDLNDIAPEAVSVGDDEDVDDPRKPWGVDYSKLVPMLIKEIQELRARVADLENK